MEIKFKYSLRSKKKMMKLDEITIPVEFSDHQPSTDKIIDKAVKMAYDGEIDPIIVDEQGVLIDGYTTYLIYKSRGVLRTETFVITTVVTDTIVSL